MFNSDLVSLVLWSIVPGYGTGVLQTIWYGITRRAGEKPAPGTKQYVNHHRRIRILVISLYLLFTIYEAHWEILKASDYYQDLRVSHTADERGVKQAFRRKAALHHPDKVSPSDTSAEAHFVHLKLGYDILMNPAKRFAYERIGPKIAEWQHCSSIQDFVYRSLRETTQHYSSTAIGFYLIGVTGFLKQGLHWRWFILASLFVFECYTITRPHFPAVADKFINPVLTTFFNLPPYLPYQLTTLFRRVVLTLYIAFSQIGPLLQSPELQKAQADPEKLLKQSLDRVDQMAMAAEMETMRLLALEMTPFDGDAQALGDIKAKATNWLVNNTIREDPDVKDAMGRVRQRRRADAPAGARGNR